MNGSGGSIEQFVHSAKLLQVNNYLAVTGITLFAYDYVQTIASEVMFIWKAKWDLGKVVFLFARYPTFIITSVFVYYITAPNLSPDTCHKLFTSTTLVGTFVIVTAEMILILRTFALSGNNRYILAGLLLIYLSATATAFFIMEKIMSSLKYGISPIPAIRRCFTIQGNSLGSIGFDLILGFEALILVITLIIGIRRFRHTHSPLVVSLYTDGIFYFVYIFLVALINIIIQATKSLNELIESLSVLQIVMHSILSCRILLHIRRNASPGHSEWEYELDTVSAMYFKQSTGTQETQDPMESG